MTDERAAMVVATLRSEAATILDGIGHVLESRGYVHMTNAEGISQILDMLDERLLVVSADILRSREINQPVAWQWRKRNLFTEQWGPWHNGSGELDLFRFTRANAISEDRLETRELFA